MLCLVVGAVDLAVRFCSVSVHIGVFASVFLGGLLDSCASDPAPDGEVDFFYNQWTRMRHPRLRRGGKVFFIDRSCFYL